MLTQTPPSRDNGLAEIDARIKAATADQPPGKRTTSRAVAQQTGASQSTVVRAWARIFPEELREPGSSCLLGRAARLIGLWADADTSLMAFTCDSVPIAPLQTPAAGSRRGAQHEAVRSLLSATESWEGSRGPAVARVRARFLHDLTTQFRERTIVVLARTIETVGGPTIAVSSPRVLILPVDDWCAQSETICRGIADANSVLVTIRDEVRRQRSTGAPYACWPEPQNLSQAAVATVVADATPSDVPALDIVDRLRAMLLGGAFASKEQLKEIPLARRLGVSRSAVRSALRILASEGLVWIRPRRGAIVPSPSEAAIRELYLARRAIGALILQTVQRKHAPLDELNDIMDRIVDAAGQGRDREVRRMDIEFQEICVRLADAPILTGLFEQLTAQTRLFVAVLGMEYSYSAQEIVAEDTSILAALRRGQGSEAASLWADKMDRTYQAMSASAR